MKIYVYLQQLSHAETWVAGGSVPLKVASTYLAEERAGTMTPDENLIHESAVPLDQFHRYGIDIEGPIKGITVTGGLYNGRPMPEVRNASRYHEDGLVLCFSTELSRAICDRFGKTCAVCISDAAALKAALDSQLGVVGQADVCTYTTDHQRNHFLKGEEDSWQKEYRFFWSGIVEDRWLDIPKGMAEHVEIP